MKSNLIVYICRALCKNGLSNDFGPPFLKPKNYLLSCNATVAKGMMLCSQHTVLVIRMELPSKHYQVSLLLTRKEQLPKCQEIAIIFAGGKILPLLPLVDGLPRQEKVFQNFLQSTMADFILPVALSSATFSD